MLFSQSDLIFSNNTRHRIARHVTFWLTCVVFFTAVYGSKPVGGKIPYEHILVTSYQLALVEAIAFLPIHIFLSYAFMYWLIPRFLMVGKYLRFLLALAACVFFMAFLSFIVSKYVLGPFRIMLDLPQPFSNFYFGLMGGLRGGLTVAGFAGAIKLAKHWYQKNQQNQQLENERVKAELQLLKAQVHPHFLFNTLNNLYALTLTQSARAPEVVLKLSGLLRYMLYECNIPQVSLSRELQLMYDYLELEQLRYGDRLDLSVNVSGEIEGKSIAPLLLIPFLENSFKHGASEHLDQAWISVDMSVRDNVLKFKVMNAVPAAENSQIVSGGLGLLNVRKRLQLIYPNGHELRTIRESETFIVSLTIRLNESTDQRSNKIGAKKNRTSLLLEKELNNLI